MKNKNNFQRYEQKYLLDADQIEGLSSLIKKELQEDNYSNSQIVSLYYDTKDFRLIRASIDADGYKEKLRIRRYFSDEGASPYFVEMKRKYQGLVYKRRREMEGQKPVLEKKDNSSQIDKELDYFFSCYPGLEPMALISYHRDAYVSKEDKDLRITLDRDIRARFNELYHMEDWSGKPVLDSSMAIMEVKSVMGYPRWFLDYLAENKVHKTSFSKYGQAYLDRLEEMRG